MCHLNNASNVETNVRIDRFRYVSGRGVLITQAQSNCSLCSCAGVITHGTGALVTSGQVASLVPITAAPLHADFNTVDPHLQHAQSFTGKGWQGYAPSDIRSAGSISATNASQIQGIMNYGSQQLGVCRVLKMGDTDAGDQPRTLREAKAYMKAMAEYGFIFAVLAPASGHWNFAHRVGQDIQFIDYQMDHPEFGGQPVVGHDFQKALGGGDLDDGTKVVVLSFQANDHYPTGPAALR